MPGFQNLKANEVPSSIKTAHYSSPNGTSNWEPSFQMPVPTGDMVTQTSAGQCLHCSSHGWGLLGTALYRPSFVPVLEKIRKFPRMQAVFSRSHCTGYHTSGLSSGMRSFPSVDPNNYHHGPKQLPSWKNTGFCVFFHVDSTSGCVPEIPKIVSSRYEKYVLPFAPQKRTNHVTRIPSIFLTKLMLVKPT